VERYLRDFTFPSVFPDLVMFPGCPAAVITPASRRAASGADVAADGKLPY